MPVYNASRYIDKCIQSIIEQNFQDFELILVDDGSKDNSVEICEQWVRRYPEKIHLVKKENSGSLFTRRRCLLESKGEYIYIVDADDYLLRTDALQRIHDTIVKSQCDLVFFNAASQEESPEGMFKYPFEDEAIFEGAGLLPLYEYYIQNSGLKPLWNKVFHRSLVDWDADYSSYTYVTNGTDYFQSTPIISNAKRICYLAEILYFYRRDDNATSIVHTFKPTVYAAARANFLRMCDASESWKLNETERHAMLTAEFMKVASTSAYKARLLQKKDKAYVRSFLKEIGEDSVFRKYYSASSVKSLSRKVIVFMLGHRKYDLLSVILMKI